MFKSNVLAVCFSVVAIISILAFPDVSGAGISKGIVICANVIIPSLFPFTFCVLMILKSNINIKCSIINKITIKIFGQNLKMFFVFLLSMVGGYPVGAKLVSELYNNKEINTKAAQTMLKYCVNAGPAFIVTVVGGVFSSQKIGYILFISHITSSVLIAIFCSKELAKNKGNSFNTNIKPSSFFDIFISSVKDTTASIIGICSYVILFSALNSLIDYFFKNMSIMKYISFFTEVTTAVTRCNNVYFVSFLLAFSGFSIWCQIFSLTSQIKINKINFIFFRLLHGTISIFITKILIKILNVKIPTFSNNVNFINKFYISNTALFFSMFIMLVVLLVYIYSKNNSGKITSDVI